MSTTACYILRGPASVKDFKSFPSNKIEKSTRPHPFQEQLGTILLPDSLTLYHRKKQIRMAFDQAFNQSNTFAFLILKMDTIVYERYDNGVALDDLVTTFSVAKSFVSALVGIAIKEGHIHSIQDKVVDYVPTLDQEAFSNLTIEQLLNMESGIKMREHYATGVRIGQYYYGNNIKRLIPKLKMDTRPGRDGYKSINTQLLGLVLEQATGRSLSQYFQEKLWQPLGAEYDASWSIDSEKNRTEKAFCCLNGRARDLAKLGYLYLNQGSWYGTQLVPKEWVDYSSLPLWERWEGMDRAYNTWYHNHWQNYIEIEKFDSIPPYNSYRLFTQDSRTTTDVQKAKYVAINKGANIHIAAKGHLDQYIYIHFEKKLVFVRFGDRSKNIWWPGLFNEIASLN